MPRPGQESEALPACTRPAGHPPRGQGGRSRRGTRLAVGVGCEPRASLNFLICGMGAAGAGAGRPAHGLSRARPPGPRAGRGNAALTSRTQPGIPVTKFPSPSSLPHPPPPCPFGTPPLRVTSARRERVPIKARHASPLPVIPRPEEVYMPDAARPRAPPSILGVVHA